MTHVKLSNVYHLETISRNASDRNISINVKNGGTKAQTTKHSFFLTLYYLCMKAFLVSSVDIQRNTYQFKI